MFDVSMRFFLAKIINGIGESLVPSTNTSLLEPTVIKIPVTVLVSLSEFESTHRLDTHLQNDIASPGFVWSAGI